MGPEGPALTFSPQLDFVGSVGKMPRKFGQRIGAQIKESSSLPYLAVMHHLTLHDPRSRGGVAARLRVGALGAQTRVQIQAP